MNTAIKTDPAATLEPAQAMDSSAMVRSARTMHSAGIIEPARRNDTAGKMRTERENDTSQKMRTGQAIYPAGKNASRLRLIFEENADQSDVFKLFGWDHLPESIKSAVRRDMEAYRDQLLGLYSPFDKGVAARRKSVSYWIKAFLEGTCSEQTVQLALARTLVKGNCH